MDFYWLLNRCWLDVWTSCGRVRREVPKMRFDGLARVSRAAAQLAFFVADVLDVYEGKAIWNVFIDSLFLNALPVLMLATSCP